MDHLRAAGRCSWRSAPTCGTSCLQVASRATDDYQVSLITTDTLRGAPVNPKSFAVDARKMHFTNGADCENVVLPRYEETFHVVMAEATKIDYRGLQVDNEKFRDIMAVFQQHSNVERIEYIDFALTELCVSMEDVLSFANTQVSGTTEDLAKLEKLTRLYFSDSWIAGTTSDLVKLSKLDGA